MFPVIKAENLSKRFRLHTKSAQGGTLRDMVAGIFRNPFRQMAETGETAETFWALRDVSFAVERGATLGIIGSNGAGKSTLLKILSRITKPTGGQAVLHGRVGSLLEVGTGFHQELSGRENIFLNGVVLGMKKREIEKKFDEIVAFAEVERFLDTPVKHYSSGMYMRLAFAIAAHLEPEILIVDEVLAVGDAAFQKKCLGKMNEFADQGRTVIFVSHNAAALQRLCKTALYLERGRLKNHGAINTILAQYHADTDINNSLEAIGRRSAEDVPNGAARFIGWRLIDSTTDQPHSIYSRETADFEFTLVSKRISNGAYFVLVLKDEQGQNIVVAHNLLGGIGETTLKSALYKLHWRMNLPLRAGTYKLSAVVHSTHGEGIFDEWEAAPPLTILPVIEYAMPEDSLGIVNVPVTFKVESENL